MTKLTHEEFLKAVEKYFREEQGCDDLEIIFIMNDFKDPFLPSVDASKKS